MPKDPRVDAYIAKAKPFAQPILKRIRSAIHVGCPDVTETIKWSVPAFDHKGVDGRRQAAQLEVHARGQEMRRRMTFRICVSAALAIGMASATPVAQAGNPISDGIRSQWNSAKRNLQQSSEIMPESSYDYRPVDGVRDFGEILAHVAGANYVFCAAARGEKPPFTEDHFEKAAKTRVAIMKATVDAIAYCDSAFTALTDASAAQLVQQPFGQGQTSRAAVLIGEIGHVNEHYGNLVTYLRINGIVPPSSRR